MLEVHVHIRVKEGSVDDFIRATLENARNSLREEGVSRFELLQDVSDPTRFILVEGYRTADAPAAHKATGHYMAWRDAVQPMMAEPRVSEKFIPLPA